MAGAIRRLSTAVAGGAGAGRRPLDGVRVLEVGQLVAGPFAATLLGYFGATVIKVEDPEHGDPLRTWRELDANGQSPWWSSIGRNKQCIAVDLRVDAGRKLVADLANTCDVLVENFKPGVMERWGLGPRDFDRTNPKLIYARVSGYGQTGPNAHLPGYASVCEAYGGFRHVNGFPGQPPARPNISLGDTLAGFHAAFGVLLALLERARGPNSTDGVRAPLPAAGRGQVVDVAIYESIFNMMEAIVPEFDRLGKVRGPSGSTITGIAPTNTYLCQDGQYVVIGANGESIFRRLADALGRPDLATNPDYSSNPARVKNQAALDALISAWTGARSSRDVLAAMAAASVPAGPIYSVENMMVDPHYQARGMFETVDAGGQPLKVPAILPKLDDTPGATTWAGPAIGEHTVSVLRDVLHLSDTAISALVAAKAIPDHKHPTPQH